MAGDLLAPQPTPAYTPKYRRLQAKQLRALLALHRAGKTQVEIAQALGCSQPTVSEWLADLQDTRDEASQYLRGKALDMALNVARRGNPETHRKTLENIEVLSAEQNNRGVVINIAGASSVQVGIAAGAFGKLTERALSEPKE